MLSREGWIKLTEALNELSSWAFEAHKTSKCSWSELVNIMCARNWASLHFYCDLTAHDNQLLIEQQQRKQTKQHNQNQKPKEKET